MPMDAKDFYTTCLTQAGSVVTQVTDDMLANQTPDDEWDVRDLVNHMLYEVSWVPDMLGGRTVAEVGELFDGDLLAAENDDVTVAWNFASNKAERAALDANLTDTAHLSYADVPIGDYLQMTGGDILVHTWDLAKAIGVPFSFDPAVAEQMWSRVKDRDLSGSGLFKPSLPIDDTASVQDKILAHFGRDIHWQPSA